MSVSTLCYHVLGERLLPLRLLFLRQRHIVAALAVNEGSLTLHAFVGLHPDHNVLSQMLVILVARACEDTATHDGDAIKLVCCADGPHQRVVCPELLAVPPTVISPTTAHIDVRYQQLPGESPQGRLRAAGHTDEVESICCYGDIAS